MQTGSHSGAISSNSQSANIAGVNGRISYSGSNGPGQHHAPPDNFIFENVDPAHLDDEDDSDSEISPPIRFRGAGQGHSVSPTGVKPGKKTKGRVKIKMEFIENKLRRYTTFSKRKTGIMKKAYELSTLTGTQVMLLVASETGHVYTFATRKLQPMITSDSGKALIQTCLNSPDPPPGSCGHTSLEQRMNPSGFEETELTYSVGEEDCKVPMMNVAARSNSQARTTATPTSFTSQPITLTTQTPSIVTASSDSSSKVTGIPLQFPGLILQTSSGQPVAIPASHLGVSTSSSQPHTVYRTASGQLVTTATSEQQRASPATLLCNVSHTTSAESSGVVTTPSLSFLSGSGNTAVTPSQIIMYQTPQGVMYAAPTPSAALGSERTIFNFQQPAAAISIPQSDSGGQQIITIPVPVSLASTSQVLQLATASTTGDTLSSEISVQAAPTKKSRKG